MGAMAAIFLPNPLKSGEAVPALKFDLNRTKASWAASSSQAALAAQSFAEEQPGNGKNQKPGWPHHERQN